MIELKIVLRLAWLWGLMAAAVNIDGAWSGVFFITAIWTIIFSVLPIFDIIQDDQR